MITRKKFLYTLLSAPFVLKTIHNIDFRLLNMHPLRTIINRNTSELDLNPAASFIIEQCNGKKTVAEIAREYNREFEIDYITSINDTTSAILYFYEIGWVEFK